MELHPGLYLWILVMYTYLITCCTFTIRNQRNHVTSEDNLDLYKIERVRRDVDNSLLCNTETSFQCRCVQCDNSPCCSSELPGSLTDNGVSLTWSSDDGDTALSTTIEATIRQAITYVVNNICQITMPPSDSDENFIICNDIYHIFSNSSSTSVQSLNIIIFSIIDDSSATSTTFTASMFLASYPEACDSMAACILEASALPQSSLLDLLTKHNTSISQFIPDLSIISATPYDNTDIIAAASPSTTTDPDPNKKFKMDLIICGGVFGGLLLCTCIISAAKAVRDRKKIKEKRAQKRLDRLRSNGSCTQLTGSTEAAHVGSENGAMNGLLITGSTEMAHIGPENGGMNGLLNGDVVKTEHPQDSGEGKAKHQNGHCQNGVVETYADKPVSNGQARNGVRDKFLQIVNVTIETSDRQNRGDMVNGGMVECDVIDMDKVVEKPEKLEVMANGSINSVPEINGLTEDKDIQNPDMEQHKHQPGSEEKDRSKRPNGKEQLNGTDEEDSWHSMQHDSPPDYNEATGTQPVEGVVELSQVHVKANVETGHDNHGHPEGSIHTNSVVEEGLNCVQDKANKGLNELQSVDVETGEGHPDVSSVHFDDVTDDELRSQVSKHNEDHQDELPETLQEENVEIDSNSDICNVSGEPLAEFIQGTGGSENVTSKPLEELTEGNDGTSEHLEEVNKDTNGIGNSLDKPSEQSTELVIGNQFDNYSDQLMGKATGPNCEKKDDIHSEHVTGEQLGQITGTGNVGRTEDDPTQNSSNEILGEGMEENREGDVETKEPAVLNEDELEDYGMISNDTFDAKELEYSNDATPSNHTNDANHVIDSDSIMQAKDNGQIPNESNVEFEEGMV